MFASNKLTSNAVYVILLADDYDDPVDPLVRTDCKRKWIAGEFETNIRNDALEDFKKHVTKISPTHTIMPEEKSGAIWGTK